MPDNGDSNRQEKIKPIEPFDGGEAAQLLGLTPQQKAFADLILKGANQTAAAKAAGYSGNENSLRAVGSKVAASSKVKAYLSWARDGAAPESIADREEIQRTLSRHLRGSDKTAALRSAEILHRLDLAEQEALANGPLRHPFECLKELFESSQFGALLALGTAHYLKLPWAPDTIPDNFTAMLSRIAELDPGSGLLRLGALELAREYRVAWKPGKTAAGHRLLDEIEGLAGSQVAERFAERYAPGEQWRSQAMPAD